MKDLDDNGKLAFLAESLLLEAKDRFLDAYLAHYRTKLANDPEMASQIQSIEKDVSTAKTLLRRYPNWEKRFDWNRLTETMPWDFHKIVLDMKKREESNRTRNREAKALKDYSPTGLFFPKNNRRFNFLGNFKNWVAVQPLNWEAAVWCADYLVGGIPGKWCISNSHDSSDWDNYCMDDCRFVFLLKKNGNPRRENHVKAMLEYRGEIEKTGERDGFPVYEWKCRRPPTVWTEEDNDIAPENWGDDGTYEKWIFSELNPMSPQDLMDLADRLEEPSYMENSVDEEDDEDEIDEDIPPERLESGYDKWYGRYGEPGII